MSCDTLLTRKTVVGVMEEVTEGTYVAPTNADMIQIVSFPGINPERELLERDIIRDAIGQVKPFLGLKAGTVELQVELRGGGESGGTSERPEAYKLYKSGLGNEHDSTAGGTTIAGSTDTVIKLGVGEGANFQRGAPVLIDGEFRAVASVSTDDLTLNSALDKGAPALGVTVAGGWSYYGADADHTPLSLTIYEDAAVSGPQFRGIGCRISSMAFSDFTRGQIPKITFTCELMNFAKAIGAVPGGVTYDDTEPNVLIYQFAERDGTTQQIQTLELTVENTVARVGDLTTEGGVACMRVTKRVVNGSIDPYQPAGNNDAFDDWDGLVDSDFLIGSGERDGSGDFQQGTIVFVWLPQANFTEYSDVDVDGIVTNNLSLAAHTSVSGGDDDIFLCFI